MSQKKRKREENGEETGKKESRTKKHTKKTKETLKEDSDQNVLEERGDLQQVDIISKSEKEEALNGHNDNLEELETSDEASLSKFRISKETIELLEKKNIQRLFPIQYCTFDYIYDGKDLIGRARTGTGKTLAFAIPIVEMLKKRFLSGETQRRTRIFPLVLVLAPTRELAKQIAEEFSYLGGKALRITCIYGGTGYESQERDFRNGVDVVIGTPGRIIDHIERKIFRMDSISYVVLDEADEMLNFGFQEDIERILSAIPKEQDRQTLLFSATIPHWVKNVAANQYLKKDHVTVDLVGDSKVKSSEMLRHLAISCPRQVRHTTLGDIVQVYGAQGRTIIFADTKAEATELSTSSSIRSFCQVLHGDINQQQREITLAGFKNGTFSCLVATDVAARGLDIPEVELVIQCQPPKDAQTYIHRAGRTARAGKTGISIIFYTRTQISLLKQIERVVGVQFQRIGTPQPPALICAATAKITATLSQVSSEIIPYFTNMANQLIEQQYNGDAVRALSAALSQLSGYTQSFGARSLLASSERYTTLRIYTKSEINSPRFISNMLQSWTCDIGEIVLCEGGALVDVPSEIAKELETFSKQQEDNNPGRSVSYRFEIAKELPKLDIIEKSSSNSVSTVHSRGGSRGSSSIYSRGGRGYNMYSQRGGRIENNNIRRGQSTNFSGKGYQGTYSRGGRGVPRTGGKF